MPAQKRPLPSLDPDDPDGIVAARHAAAGGGGGRGGGSREVDGDNSARRGSAPHHQDPRDGGETSDAAARLCLAFDALVPWVCLMV
jgi:hypothetical protein